MLLDSDKSTCSTMQFGAYGIFLEFTSNCPNHSQELFADKMQSLNFKQVAFPDIFYFFFSDGDGRGATEVGEFRTVMTAVRKQTHADKNIVILSFLLCVHE